MNEIGKSCFADLTSSAPQTNEKISRGHIHTLTLNANANSSDSWKQAGPFLLGILLTKHTTDTIQYTFVTGFFESLYGTDFRG